MPSARKFVAAAVLVTVIATTVVCIYAHLREKRVDSQLRFNSMSGTKYRIVFDSFDPDSRIVQAHASVELYSDAAYFRDRAFFSSIGVSQLNDVKLYHGPITFADLGERVNDSGLLIAKFDENVYPSTPDATYRKSFPPTVRCELHA